MTTVVGRNQGFFRVHIYRQDGAPGAGGKEGRAPLGRHVLPLVDSGPFGEDQQLAVFFRQARADFTAFTSAWPRST